MEIIRYDEIEFDILNILTNGIGYYNGGEYTGRAILMMKEGILVENPRTKWRKSCWKLTDLGREYASAFFARVRSEHGHEWETNRDTNPDLYNDREEYGNQINWFAMESGSHNGPRCKKCGLKFCHNCESEFTISPCSKK